MLFNIQHFSIDDGPGVRTVVFMKGCNLHCFWCHNPESWSKEKTAMFWKDKCVGCGNCDLGCPTGARTVCGYEMDCEQLMEVLMRDKRIYEISGGGVTFSGGEPFLQADFLMEMLSHLD